MKKEKVNKLTLVTEQKGRITVIYIKEFPRIYVSDLNPLKARKMMDETLEKLYKSKKFQDLIKKL